MRKKFYYLILSCSLATHLSVPLQASSNADEKAFPPLPFQKPLSLKAGAKEDDLILQDSPLMTQSTIESLSSVSSLDKISSHILVGHIASFLDMKTLIQLTQVCKRFYTLNKEMLKGRALDLRDPKYCFFQAPQNPRYSSSKEEEAIYSELNVLTGFGSYKEKLSEEAVAKEQRIKTLKKALEDIGKEKDIKYKNEEAAFKARVARFIAHIAQFHLVSLHLPALPLTADDYANLTKMPSLATLSLDNTIVAPHTAYRRLVTNPPFKEPSRLKPAPHNPPQESKGVEKLRKLLSKPFSS